mgnify:CR=1 FL=1
MTHPAAEIVRERLLPLCGYDEDSVDAWLTIPHPALDGATPQELIDAGEGEAVLKLVDHIAFGAPA